MRHLHILMLSAALTLAHTAQAQLFAPPQPLMYRAAADLEHPPKGVSAISIARYIPGSRFPNSWDMLVEQREYDAAGRLTTWKRFDSFNGNRIMEKKISYTTQGDLAEERTWRVELQREEVLKYANTYDASGKWQSVTITDGAGKPAGSGKATLDGGRETTMQLSGGKRLVLVHDARGRLLSMWDESNGSADKYTYDNLGEIVAIERTRAGKTTNIQYRSVRDAQGHVVQQDEVLPEGMRRMFFEYDKAGHLIARKWDPARPTEAYAYNALGVLTDIMQYSTDGHPKEIFNYMTAFRQQ